MSNRIVNHWGFSPAVDLQEELRKIFYYLSIENQSLKNDEANFLILGSTDGRHILKTMANIQQHSRKFINMYFMEDSYVNICRQLLFLHLFCEQESKRSLLETAEVFLEIFGNTLVRHSTYEIITEIAGSFRALADSAWTTTLPFICLDALKHQELNCITGIYRHWQKPSVFDIKLQWENRLRRDLGTRYDCRRNMYDWDFHTKLNECPVIGLQKYLEWRETGVAFKCRESRYTYPNLTLHQHREYMYLGDVYSSPYLAYGIETDNEKLLQKVNGVYEKTSEDVSLYNVICLLKSIKGLQPVQDHAKIHPLVSNNGLMAGKLVDDNFKGLCDCIYISYDFNIDMELIRNLLKENGLLLAETLKYNVKQSKEYKVEYFRSLKSKADEAGLKSLDVYDFEKHSFVAFTKSP